MDLKDKRILITGATGLVGKHLQEELEQRGIWNVHLADRSILCDLRDPYAARGLFDRVRPQVVFHLAAKVGGILDNQLHPADFFFDNMRMGMWIFNECAKYKVEKLINVGAGCGYPVDAPQPLREEDFWNGYPQAESAAYSLAKKMLVAQGIAYRQQYGLSSITLIPSNIYGEWDNFNLERAHVIPALIRKFHDGPDEDVEVWGDGSAKRDFIHVSDVAKALVDAAESYDSDLPLNVACGTQHSIWRVARILADLTGRHTRWNRDKPSGQYNRAFSVNNLRKYLPNFTPQVTMEKGLVQTYKWFADNYYKARK